VSRKPLRLAPLVLALLLGCTPSAPPNAPQPHEKNAAPAPPRTKKEQLSRLLVAIPRPSDVLGALGKGPRAELDGLVQQIGSADREALAKNDGSLAHERPLLHLAVGGTSRAAYYEIATSSRASDELVSLRHGSGKTTFDDLVPAVRELARRAAERYLHDVAADAASPNTELLDRIDRAAFSLDRDDLIRLDRQIAVELAPDEAGRWLALAHSSASALDVEEANAALAHAREKKAGAGRLFGTRLARTERVVAAAETVRTLRGHATDTATRLRLARAYLVIDRPEDAARALAPDRAAAKTNLGVAGALAVAELGGSICPGLPAYAATSLLCAAAWHADPSATRAVELMTAAWKSGAGRDADGLAAYIGLVQVVPWMYGLMTLQTSSAEDLARTIKDRLAGLRAAVHAAAQEESTFEGLELFSTALAAGFEAAANEKNAQLPEAAREKLLSRAKELAHKSPADRFTQGGVLAVSALLFRNQDVLPLIELLPGSSLSGNQLAYDVLRLWGGLAAGKADVVQSASGDVGALVSEYSPEALERPKLLLLLAEGDALLQGTDKAYGVLERVAKPLTDATVPPEVRLRAAIDVAGAQARGGKLQQAADLLQRVVSTIPAVGSGSQTLAYVAASYLYVLRARLAKGDEREEYVKRFLALTKEPLAAKAPDGVELWRSMWENELSYLAAEERCGAVRVCTERARAKRGLTAKEIDERVGAHAGKLLRRGALPGGTLSVSFTYSGAAGLETVISVEPQLLAVEVPRAR
jgi:hypothetical protein